MDRIHLHFPFLALRSEVQRPLLLVCLLCSLSHAEAQEEREDSVALGEERRCHQNVLLNATSSTQPRILSLGLPRQSSYILQDGLPSSSFSHFFPSFLSWHWGLGTENLKVTTLDESALEMGEMGYFASTTTRNGVDRLEAAVDYTLGQYGRNVIDVLVGTPLRNGWSLNLNALQDMEKVCNHIYSLIETIFDPMKVFREYLTLLAEISVWPALKPRFSVSRQMFNLKDTF